MEATYPARALEERNGAVGAAEERTEGRLVELMEVAMLERGEAEPGAEGLPAPLRRPIAS